MKHSLEAEQNQLDKSEIQKRLESLILLEYQRLKEMQSSTHFSDESLLQTAVQSMSFSETSPK